MRFTAAGRRAEQIGDLRGPPAQDVAQDQHGPLPCRQVLARRRSGQPRALPRRGDLGWIGGPGAHERVGASQLQPWNLRLRMRARSFSAPGLGRLALRTATAVGRCSPARPGRRWSRSRAARSAATPAPRSRRRTARARIIVSCTWPPVPWTEPRHRQQAQQLRPERVGETREILADCQRLFLRHGCSSGRSRGRAVTRRDPARPRKATGRRGALSAPRIPRSVFRASRICRGERR